MKKNLNIIQIKGIRGLLLAGFVVCCLAAGFIAFPGLVSMYIWNFAASSIEGMPAIGLLQGTLLWGIIIAGYFTFRRNKLIVCVKSPQGLSEEELKTVFADLKKQTKEDSIMQAMLKAKEAELKVKTKEEAPSDSETTITTDNSNV